MANKIDKSILEELKRFQAITNNSENLNEQMVGGMATFEMGSHVDRLLKRAKAMEMEEQEEEVIPVEDESEIAPVAGEEEEIDVEAEATPPEAEGGEEGGEDIETAEVDIDAEVEETPEGDETELDVTDLVSKQEEVNTELSGQKDILQKLSLIHI